MKALRVIGLAAVLLLASFGSGVTRVSAQSGWTFSQILDKLVAAGGKIQSKTIITGNKYTRFLGKCKITVVLPQTEPLVTGNPEAWLLKIAGIPVTYANRGILFDIGLIGALNQSGQHIAEFSVDSSFCNPPSGDAKAQNPVPVPVRAPHPQHDDPANLMNLVIASLVVLGVGFLFFPQLARSFVRI